MSVAYDLDLGQPAAPAHPARQRPLSLVPSPRPTGPTTRPDERPARRQQAASVALLRTLDDPAPLRLTRRGVVVLSVVLAVAGAAVMLLASLSARSSGAGSATVGPAVVTVRSGDTLWSIASHAAPGRDPRAEIATIHRLNALRGEALVPGQRLRVR